ncbi:MAG: HAMP domain-containing protein [Opitutaceae bacterium]|nr:HAMP domain-containing protein [Opitutaceae bacterium]
MLPLLLLLMLVGAAGIAVCRNLGRSMEEKLAQSFRMVLAAHEMRDAATRATAAIHRAQDGFELEARPDYEHQRGRFKKALMAESFAAAGTARARALETVADAFGGMEAQGDAVFATGAPVTRESYLAAEVMFFNALKSLDTLMEADQRALQGEAKRVSEFARAGARVLAAAIAAGIALSLWLAWRLARSILQPIKSLTLSARALGDGDLEHDVPVASRDELGELARTFNAMAAKLRAYRDAMTASVVRARRTMEATLTSTPDPLFIIARDGSTELRNPAAEALAAAPEFAGGFPAPLAARIREVLEGGAHFLPSDYRHVVMARLGPDGRDERFYLPRILAIGDELTGFGGAAMILQDVTKFRLLDDAKNNLVGTVSHELKSPLTSLRLAVYLLLENNSRLGTLTPRQRDLLETARDDADRLLRILNDILDLSRIEGGRAALSRRDTPVRPLLAAMAREIKPLADDAGQRVEIEVDEAVATVFLDPERIRHVFINLLGNAAKYSPGGGVITLYARPADGGGDDGAWVRFGVRDRGPGIPADAVPSVFEKFYRVPGQTRKGAGLGLAIAREIVLAHGGFIACASKEGEGSDFYFHLPAAPPE